MIDADTIDSLSVNHCTLVDPANNHDKFYDIYQVQAGEESYVVVHYGRNGASGVWKSAYAGSKEEALAFAQKLLNDKFRKGYEAEGRMFVDSITRFIAVSSHCQPWDPSRDPSIAAKIPGDALATLIEDARRAIGLAADPNTTYEAASLRESLNLSVSEVRERLLFAESQLEIVDLLVRSKISGSPEST